MVSGWTNVSILAQFNKYKLLYRGTKLSNVPKKARIQQYEQTIIQNNTYPLKMNHDYKVFSDKCWVMLKVQYVRILVENIENMNWIYQQNVKRWDELCDAEIPAVVSTQSGPLAWRLTG